MLPTHVAVDLLAALFELLREVGYGRMLFDVRFKLHVTVFATSAASCQVSCNIFWHRCDKRHAG